MDKTFKSATQQLQNYKMHHCQLLRASSDHQSSVLGGQSCRNNHPIWRTAAVSQ